MKVNMESVNFTVDRKLVDFIQRKMDKGKRMYKAVQALSQHRAGLPREPVPFPAPLLLPVSLR